MKSITRTAYGAYLNNCILQGLPFKVIPNTTLNEKLGINKQQSLGLPQDHYPQLRYLCMVTKDIGLSLVTRYRRSSLYSITLLMQLLLA